MLYRWIRSFLVILEAYDLKQRKGQGSANPLETTSTLGDQTYNIIWMLQARP